MDTIKHGEIEIDFKGKDISQIRYDGEKATEEELYNLITESFNEIVKQNRVIMIGTVIGAVVITGAAAFVTKKFFDKKKASREEVEQA